MGRFEAGAVYLAAILLWLGLTVVYYPVLSFLGVPDQPAIASIGVGTLLVIGLLIRRAVMVS